MINQSNIKEVLAYMGFHKEPVGNFYTKKFGAFNMSVDFDNKTLNYPKGVVLNDKTTSNFSHDENFVVFECVNRLMEKGYLPETIELEPRWQLGLDSKSSGKADILIKDRSGNSLIIIECKTAGKEYRKAKRDTEANGGQLFSYWQQVTSTKWLALYSSDWKDGKICIESSIINCTDDANILKMSEKDKDVKVYAKASEEKDRFEVWRDTYNCQWLADLIFSEDSQPYQIELKPLRKKDLKDFTPDDKIVNQFEEILRHNNVSDKENAFNRLVALFICKLVDEIKKQDYEEVDFQYKYTDTYETLQDRLQRLHQQGMEEFMKEKIFYVDDGYAERLFENYTGQKRKAAIEDLKHTIRVLKFYSNNDFAFKDVHNEELFYQNGKILVEVVQLFQPYRIVYQSKHQFLGDLFEQLLNKGFKQNEGQFFTPTPITRFIWDALPLSNYISEHDLPRIIDYACGAGHFLTEGVEAVNAIRPNEENNWVEKHIYGVEKDYRLARVSKVSMFMNGAGGSNIIFGDGLENYPEKGIEPHSFDILVANPPYSVNGFKRHLSLHNNEFSILKQITLEGKEIETLFVERIAQLLKPQGIAAVVLPSTILTTESSCYTAARKVILKNFKIRAVVTFGSKAFSATNTQTIVLFLEKYKEPPHKSELVKDFVTAVMENHVTNDWKDKDLFLNYLEHQCVDEEIYYKFVDRELDWEELASDKYFKGYYNAFQSQTIVFPRALQTAEEEEKYKRDKFYDYAITIETQKLYYFAMAYQQRTLVITSPEDTKAQKEFLGYEWSNRRGYEGIKIIRPGGMLYNSQNRSARGTIACSIRNSYEGAFTLLKDPLDKYVSWRPLIDLLVLNKADFNVVLDTTVNVNQDIQCKYPLVNLYEYMESNKFSLNPKNTPEKKYKYVDISSVGNGNGEIKTSIEFLGKDAPSRARRLAKSDSLIISTVRPNLKSFAYIAHEAKDTLYSTGFAIIKSKDSNVLLTKFIYYCFMGWDGILGQLIRMMPKGQYPSVNASNIAGLQIPIPPKNVQEKIIRECDILEDEYKNGKLRLDVEEERRQAILDKYLK